MNYRVIRKEGKTEIQPGAKLHSYTGVWYFESAISGLKVRVVSSWDKREESWPEVKRQEFSPQMFGLEIQNVDTGESPLPT